MENKDLKNSENAKITDEENKYILDSINHWIDNADTKISIAFGILSAVFAAFGLIAGFNSDKIIPDKISIKIAVLVFLCLCVCAFLAALIIFALALIPHLGNTKKRKEDSFSIFYGDIASCIDLADFKRKDHNATKDDVNEKLIEEIYVNSKICLRKMKYFRVGLVLSIVGILLMTVAFAILLFAAQR